MHGKWTYQAFFAAPPDIVAAAQTAIHARPAEPRHYAPGEIDNWQAQHPPLYYLVLAPAYLVSNGWSLGGQLFLLRAHSYLIAWAGLCIVTIGAPRLFSDPRTAAFLSLGAATWSTIFPGWFPEMGRLGNDSLITVFAAVALILLYRVRQSHARPDHALLGIVLGLGLLTKATFLPVVVAVFVLLGVLVIRARRTNLTPRAGAGFCLTAAITAALAGWWYLAQLLGTGSAIGSNDVITMRAAGGLIAGLTKHLDSKVVTWAPWDVAASFLWPSTWSFILPPRVALLPIIALAIALGFQCLRYMYRHPREPVDWFPPLTLALFISALAYHSFILLSIVGATAPAWYLHSLAPILALLVGYGMQGAVSTSWHRGIVAALLLYVLAFLAVMTMVNVLFFAGCGPILPGRRYFAWSTGIDCLADPSRIYNNVAVLAFPELGGALFVVGWIFMLAGAILIVRRRTEIIPSG
jgi:4-amino-4-deoxy-L-arabinose transferase-like glycosyltransferase